MPKPMRVKLMGRQYRVQTRKLPTLPNGDKQVGFCDPPDQPGRGICLDPRIRGRHHLEIALHEGLHACRWWGRHKWVEQAAKDLATLLWKLGYRKRPKKCRKNA